MHRRTTSSPQQSWQGLGVSRRDSDFPPLDSADDATGARQYGEDEPDNEHERYDGGMSPSSSVGAPSNLHEPGSIPATEAARSRSFKALRTAKACDICKIRKVKCDGGEPCASCHLHNSACIYSKTTRKKLLSLSENSARNGQSVIPKNPRGRPMTTDIGNWAIRQQSSDVGADNMAGPGGSSSNNPGTAHTKRRRHSSSPDVRDAVNQANGTFSNARTQLPVLDPNLAPAAFYHDVRRGAPKDSRTFEVSDVRFPYMASNAGQHLMQAPIDTMGSVPSQSGQPLFTTYKDISDAYTLPRISDTTQASSSKTKDTPSSIQAISAGLMSAPTTTSTPRSGSGQSGLPGVMPLDYGTKNAPYGGPEVTRTASHVGGYDNVRDTHPFRQSPLDHNSSTYSTSTQRNTGEREQTQRAWLRSQRTPDTIFGAEADALGNAGITTVQHGKGVSNALWWGPTSFLSLQDRLIQVLKARGQVEPQIDPDLMTTAPEGGSSVDRDSQSDSDDARSNYTVWRWGCNKLIFGTKPQVDETVIPIDPLFLPSQLAHRFFRAYVVTIHIMYPVMDIDEVRGSISVAYAGGVDYRSDKGTQPSKMARSLHQARNLMVLALGAQIEGGDGDAHCPKDIARAWSTKLADRAHNILLETRDNGGVEAVRIWILYTVFLGNYGQVAEQYLAIGHASRLVLSLGLHRDSTCRQDQRLRVVFWTTYVLEKTISLWQGRPSCLNVRGEIDTFLPLSDQDSKINALRTVVDLVDFVDNVQAIYFNHDRDASRISAIDKVNEVFEELEALRRSVPEEMLDFHSPDPDSPGILLAVDTPEGEMALFKFRLCLLYHNIRMLATLPLLSYIVWQDVTKQPFTANPEAVRIAAECVSSAENTILAFQVYMAQIPYLPFMGDFTMMLLFAIPVLYLDSLRYEANSIARRNVEVLRIATGVLQHFDHPAGDVCEKMVQDFFDNYLHRPDWSAPSMQLQSAAIDTNSTGSKELLSWLTSPYERGGQRAA